MNTWTATIVLGVLAFGCDRGGPPPPEAKTATSAEPGAAQATIGGARARELVAGGAKLVDVRSAAEFADEHVDGAENVPVDAIGERELGPTDTPIVVYCHSGRRSARAASALRARGYTNVYDLGGMSSWYE
ncbi:MAG: rhodanese-like domain-containing protein [Labilithrix sp.]|nr:rhodanese-like domain-containing protein [Labilithrix sp.]MCW5831219.1 rhodanese-like domain-containing protein [Labilithrix sp.]